jgi:hypothetical protein
MPKWDIILSYLFLWLRSPLLKCSKTSLLDGTSHDVQSLVTHFRVEVCKIKQSKNRLNCFDSKDGNSHGVALVYMFHYILSLSCVTAPNKTKTSRRNIHSQGQMLLTETFRNLFKCASEHVHNLPSRCEITDTHYLTWKKIKYKFN